MPSIPSILALPKAQDLFDEEGRPRADDDVQKTYDELTAKGVEFAQPPKSEPWGVMAILKDSEGNQLVLSTAK